MRTILLASVLWVLSAAAHAASFLVFFDWDRATLTGETAHIIHQAADLALQTHASVTVDGFTDTSGTVNYNNGLSWHRVQAVVAELARDGVPSSAIHAQGYGEAFPRVPTPDDVREPQNRRVRITVAVPPPPPPHVVIAPPPMVAYPYPYFYAVPWGFYRPWMGRPFRAHPW